MVAASQVTVSRNSVFGNTGFGIDLTSGAVTPNSGTLNAAEPNAGMNYPVLTRADVSAGQLTVAGYVGSAPGQSAFAGATVELFRNDATGGSASGRTYLGTLTADASGNFSGTISSAGPGCGRRRHRLRHRPERRHLAVRGGPGRQLRSHRRHARLGLPEPGHDHDGRLERRRRR